MFSAEVPARIPPLPVIAEVEGIQGEHANLERTAASTAEQAEIASLRNELARYQNTLEQERGAYAKLSKQVGKLKQDLLAPAPQQQQLVVSQNYQAPPTLWEMERVLLKEKLQNNEQELKFAAREIQMLLSQPQNQQFAAMHQELARLTQDNIASGNALRMEAVQAGKYFSQLAEERKLTKKLNEYLDTAKAVLEEDQIRLKRKDTRIQGLERVLRDVSKREDSLIAEKNYAVDQWLKFSRLFEDAKRGVRFGGIEVLGAATRSVISGQNENRNSSTQDAASATTSSMSAASSSATPVSAAPYRRSHEYPREEGLTCSAVIDLTEMVKDSTPNVGTQDSALHFNLPY
jgi:hypothetical protein